MRHKIKITKLRMVRFVFTVLTAATALSVLPDQATGQGEKYGKKIPIAEAEKRIAAHVAYIEKREGEMEGAFYYEGARNTLQTSFKKSGVTSSMTYADPWGKAGIGLFWSESVRQFYSYHRDVLTASLSVIQKQGFAKESDLVYLDKGMEAWKQYDQQFQKLFQVIVDLYTKRALVNDEWEADWAKHLDLRREKPFDDRTIEIEKDMQKVKEEIAKLAGEHLFKGLNESGRIETGSAIGANERERP